MAFNEDDPRYNCCCKRCHIIKGCWIVGIFEMICVLLNFLANIRSINQGGLGVGAFTLSSIVVVVFAVVLVIFFLGLKQHNPRKLLPHLAWSACMVIMQIVIIIVIILGLVSGGLETLHGLVSSDSQQQEVQAYIEREDQQNVYTIMLLMVTICIFIALVLGILLEVWFFVIVFCGYRYLKDKAHYQDTTPASVPLVSVGVNPQPFSPPPPSDDFKLKS